MPAKTEKQRVMFAIAAHEPEKLYKRNKSALTMSKAERRKMAHKKRKS